MTIQFRRNRNGFAVATIHYSSDPEKDEAWVARERQGMPDWSWRKEMEMDPSAAAGKLVFPELVKWAPHIYVPLSKVVKGGVIPDWWPRYAGFDWGRRNPSAIELCAVTPDDVLVFYWELYRANLKPHQLDRIMKAHPDWGRIELIGHDPSMVSMTSWGGGVRGEDEERTLADTFAEFGWPMCPGLRGDDVAFSQELYASWRNLDSPKVVITHACPNLWKELNGLRHEELNVISINKKNDPEQIVKKGNHAFHAIKYIVRLNPSGPDFKESREHMPAEQRVQQYTPPEKRRERDEEFLDEHLGAFA